MFLSDSVDFSCFIAKSVGQYNAQNDIFLANILHARNRILSCSFGANPANDVTKFIDLRDNFSKNFSKMAAKLAETQSLHAFYS